jgi:hypothetical protein
MQYLIFFPFPSQPETQFVIDLKRRNAVQVRDAIYYIDKFDLHCYLSNFKSLHRAYQRNAQGEIKQTDMPKRIKPQEAIQMLEALQGRGRDKQPRKMHPNSLFNLKPALPFTRGTAPKKPTMISDIEVSKAKELKANGASWAAIGDTLGKKKEAIRSAVRRHSLDS